jgi:cysteine desulfuration protein SufE
MTASKIDDIISDFELIDDWEDRYRHVIDLGRALPPMDVALKTNATKVAGCASQVWIHTQLVETAKGKKLQLVGDSDALIVKGLIALVFAIFGDIELRAIDNVDTQAIFARLGLKDHLTPQRSNGLASMVVRIKQDASKYA